MFCLNEVKIIRIFLRLSGQTVTAWNIQKQAYSKCVVTERKISFFIELDHGQVFYIGRERGEAAIASGVCIIIYIHH